MSELDQIEFQRGQAIGREVMAYHAGVMAGLETDMRALVPVEGDPAGNLRAQLRLLDQGLTEVDRVTDQVQWLMDGAVPAEVAEAFSGFRVGLEETKRAVRHQLIQVVALTN